MSSKIAWSWSRLNAFETCPRQFHHVNILKDVPKKDWSYLEEGKRVHKMLEKAVNQGGGGEVDERIIHMMPMIYKFCVAFPEVHAEKQFTFREDYTETGWFEKDAYIRCALDVIGIAGDKAAILDWKTGKPWPDQGQLALNGAILMMARPEIEEVSVAYVYVDHRKSTEIKKYTRKKDFEPLWDQFEDRAELIQLANQSGVWQPKQNRFCSTCPCSTKQCEFKK